MTTIILPAEDILKAAKQAPEAKGGEEKKEAPKDDQVRRQPSSAVKKRCQRGSQ